MGHDISGIYSIRCVTTGSCYIGSAVNISDRWKRHRRVLNKGVSPSPHLQNAWNKYGAGAFVLDVIEQCDVACLLEREQHFIDTMTPSLNCARYAGAPMRGRKHSEAWKSAMSQRMIGNKHAVGMVFSEQWKVENGLRMKGRRPFFLGYRHTQQAKAAIASAMRGKRHALGSKPSVETLAKRSAGIKAAHRRNPKRHSEATRAKISAALTGRVASAETVEKRVAVIKATWARKRAQRLETKYPLLTGSV